MKFFSLVQNTSSAFVVQPWIGFDLTFLQGNNASSLTTKIQQKRPCTWVFLKAQWRAQYYTQLNFSESPVHYLDLARSLQDCVRDIGLWMCVCVCVCVCVCACVRACLRACVRACVLALWVFVFAKGFAICKSCRLHHNLHTTIIFTSVSSHHHH